MTEEYRLKYALACAILMAILIVILNRWYDKKEIEFNKFMELGFIFIMAALTFTMIVNILYVLYLIIIISAEV